MRKNKITLDKIPFHFGKYKGMTSEQIFTKDIDYIVFAYYNYKDAPISKELVRYCESLKCGENNDYE